MTKKTKFLTERVNPPTYYERKFEEIVRDRGFDILGYCENPEEGKTIYNLTRLETTFTFTLPYENPKLLPSHKADDVEYRYNLNKEIDAEKRAKKLEKEELEREERLRKENEL